MRLSGGSIKSARPRRAVAPAVWRGVPARRAYFITHEDRFRHDSHPQVPPRSQGTRRSIANCLLLIANC
jgi:hypothetical protein